MRQVADVRYGGPLARGDGSVNSKPAVILTVQKQPGADTLTLDRKIEATLDAIQATLPADVKIEQNIFKQANFITVAIKNVEEAIRDGALWVVVVLFLFLWNFRTSAITLTAIPLSIILTALVFHFFGLSINTMTLGGLAVAIGELVDDSIVDVENIYRRLKENRNKPQPDNPIKVIFLASAEVRNSIVYATLIVVLVVMPLFSLGGLEGRMFAPLGLSYLLTLLASLGVSLTVTPVLASYLLPKAKFLEHAHDPALLRWLKRIDERVLHITLRHAGIVLAITAVLATLSVSAVLFMGGEFMPPFNEGSLTIGATAPPATSLDESNRIGRLSEDQLREVPEVTHTSRRTGRAELDEHAENVNYSEIDVGLIDHEQPKPGLFFAAIRAIPGLAGFGINKQGRPRDEVLADIRGASDRCRAWSTTSASRSRTAWTTSCPASAPRLPSSSTARTCKSCEPRRGKSTASCRMCPASSICRSSRKSRSRRSRHGVARERRTLRPVPADVADALETALQGRKVSQVLEGQRTFDLVVWFDEKLRNDVDVVRSTLLTTPSARVALGTVAEVVQTTGPNTINRENVVRRIVVMANVAGRDLVSVVREIQTGVTEKVLPTLSAGYFVEYGGQFEAQQEANLRLLVMGFVAVSGVFLLLLKCLGSWRAAVQVMVNIPLAAIGAVLALLLTQWPTAEALQRRALLAMAARVDSGHQPVGRALGRLHHADRHRQSQRHHDDLALHPPDAVRGRAFRRKDDHSRQPRATGPRPDDRADGHDRAGAAGHGRGQTGKEILHPLAVVVMGGLISSTLMDQIVTPALFFKFGRKVYEHRFEEHHGEKAHAAVERLAEELDD